MNYLSRLLLVLGLLAAGLSAGWPMGEAATQAPKGPWSDLTALEVQQTLSVDPGTMRITAAGGRYLRLDRTMMGAILATAPDEAELARGGGIILRLPMPDGAWQRFRVVYSPIMELALAARFPQIRTYLAQGLDDPAATARLDMTPQGFHAAILSPNGAVYIDPPLHANTELYVAYAANSLQTDPLNLAATRHPPIVRRQATVERSPAAPAGDSGPTLRTYRLAVAATGEYTIFHGGTVPLGQAAIVSAINRVNGLYETEVAVRLVLVANNNLLVYTNPATDPYTNNDGYEMLFENQATIDSVIGSANYDVGHVFSTGGGGIAGLGVPCDPDYKAEGVTGLPSPTGEPFYIDYVAHEMGHQFGANHTFNSNAGSCGGGNREASTAYEPGSGSTIMGYAGICDSHDLQSNSDPYFHTISFDEIVAFTTGYGDGCAVKTATGNAAPVIAPQAGYTIPKYTPFTLTGSASDPNGHALTYAWEQFNLGAAGAPPPVASYVTPPHFRSFNPSTNPARTFPKMSDIVTGVTTIGEILPANATTLSFRQIVRDNRAGGGGVAYTTVPVTVASSGPFQVTAPNTAAILYAGNSYNVTWNVAGTNNAPVSCASINIHLSTDGGTTYPTLVVGATPNDGSQSVTIPNILSSSARMRISCASNIFFDISNVDFTIQEAPGTPYLIKSVALAPVLPDYYLQYSLQATNDGESGLTNVSVVDTLPGDVSFVSASPDCTHNLGVVTCPIALLNIGASQTFTVTVQINGDATPGTLTNTGELSGAFIDPYPDDNTSTVEVLLVPNKLLLPVMFK